MKTLTVQQLIEKLQVIEDKSSPVLFGCERCEIVNDVLVVSSGPRKIYWHAEDQECPNDENGDLDFL